MTRTMIDLNADEKAWLKTYAAQQGTSMAEVVRSAIRRLRQSSETGDQSFLDELLDQTKGIWTRGDGLEYQKSLRNEWS